MANTNSDGGTRLRGLGKEITGVVLLAAAVYSAISLLSYDSPSNWGGLVGDQFSAILLFLIGYTSYFFPILLLVISVEFILRRGFTFRPALPISFLIFVGALSAAFSAIVPEIDPGVTAAATGGIVGDIFSTLLVSYLGLIGAVIVLVAVVVIAVLVSTGLSIPGATRAVGRGMAATGGVLATAASALGTAVSNREKKRPEAPATKPAARSAPAIVTPPEPRKEAAPPKIHEGRKSPVKAAQEDEKEEELKFTAPGGDYRLPGPSLLDPMKDRKGKIDNKVLLENSTLLAAKLRDFGIEGRVVEVHPGPVVTMYEFEPAPGIKVNRITSLSDDIALAMRAISVRIIAPVPGKSVVGIEVPNHIKEMIGLKDLLRCDAFAGSASPLSLALGQDISGNPYVADFARMPHLLVAGATGTGKSVSVNAMILSILYKATPDDVRFVMVDPKMLELSAYEGIPHLITPVITDPKKAAGALRSIVGEMGRRYKLMSQKGVRNIDRYNRVLEAEEAEKGKASAKAADRPSGSEGAKGAGEDDHRRLPYIVVVIDELADLMMTSGKDVEDCLVRLSQMARAAGIHLLVATQRPSVDVITGLVKTNFPARIAFQLPSRTDSRTILDTGGAETLLGEGDMLYMPPGSSKLQRVHGVYVSEGEIKRVTEFWKKQGSPLYDETIIEETESYANPVPGSDEDLGEEFLRRYDEAVELASTLDMISTSYIQRRFRIGYNTAARIIEKMEAEGVVGPSQGSRPREVLLRKAGE